MIYKAIEIINEKAKKTKMTDKSTLQSLFERNGIENFNIDEFIRHLLCNCDITINFHPDRFSNNGKLIIDNLLMDSLYHNQYKTGTSNGGLNAHMGGNRDLWEMKLFDGAYHEGNSDLDCRPKYGALNILNYRDGASSRFGSCFFTVSKLVFERTTYAYGDSSTNPDVMGTSQNFIAILRVIIEDVLDKRKLLNIENYSIQDAFNYLKSIQKGNLHKIGHNLDDCIEAHIHGELDLSNSVDCFYMDGFFIGTEIETTAKSLCDKYNINLHIIPERKYDINKIDDEWKGPLARPLAERVNQLVGNNCGYINAAILGKASCDCITHFKDWAHMGNEFELFQNFKYLWHYVAYYGQ